MTPHSTSGLRKLDERCGAAIVRLRDFVQSRAQRFAERPAWGQFLDAATLEGQVGIYGTTSAIRILAETSYATVQPALAILPGLTCSNPDQPSQLLDSTDLDLVYKLVCILNAIDPEAPHLPRTQEPAEVRLTGMCINGRGWGYHARPGDPDLTPRVLPTALALLALSRSETFVHGAEIDSVADWFIGELESRAELPAFHQAFGLLALERLGERIGARPGYARTHETILSRLAKWTTGRSAALVQYDEHVHYHVPEPPGVTGRNHYAFFPPDVIVAWALLVAGNPASTRRYVLNVVKAVCVEIEKHQSFESLATRKSAASDALWSYELLRAFRRRYRDNRYSLLSPVYAWLSKSPWRKVITVLGGVVAAAVPGYVGLRLGGAGWDTASTLWMTLLGGLLVTIAASWMGGRT